MSINAPEGNCETEPCPVEDAIHIVGGKWKLLLIRVLLIEGPRRFNELSRRLPQISAKVLTQNLRELEDDCVVERDGPHYQVTKAGAKLMPIMHSLGEWTASLTDPDGPELSAPEAELRRTAR